jgi:hypothetical protein
MMATILPRVVHSGAALSFVEPEGLPNSSNLRTVTHIGGVWLCDCFGFKLMGDCPHIAAVLQHQAGRP